MLESPKILYVWLSLFHALQFVLSTQILGLTVFLVHLFLESFLKHPVGGDNLEEWVTHKEEGKDTLKSGEVFARQREPV